MVVVRSRRGRLRRPAGPLFRSGGILYRPSQDCSFTYGHSVSINRVDALTEGEVLVWHMNGDDF